MFLAALVLACRSGVEAATSERPADEPLRLLTTMREVRDLNPQEANRGYPVKVRAVVTGFILDYALGYFVADETGPGYIFRDPDDRKPRPPLEIGQLLEIEGVSRPGSYAPQVLERKSTLAGRGLLPERRRLNYEQLASGAEDCQFAEIEGVVRNVTATGLTLAMGPGRVDVGYAHPNELTTLVDARVRLRGVVCGVFNRKRQWVGVRFTVSNREEIIVERPAPADPFAAPAHAVPDLLQWTLNQAGPHRVKVRGVVTHFQPGAAIFIREGSTGLLVRTEETQALVPGDIVEALGFPASGTYSAVLDDAVFRRVGHTVGPEPQPVPPVRLLSGEWDSSLVSVRGVLLESVRQQGARVLVMQEGDIIFHARLAAERAIEPELPVVGSLLDVTGICIVAETTVNGARLSPRLFSLLLRSRDDIRTVREPSWWTKYRLWQALAVSLFAVLGILMWVWLLRRQVRAQTAALKEQTHREAILEERTRIAQELHDTLDQELTGISLQLNAAAAPVRDGPIGRRLEVVSRLLQRSQSEVRRSVWDLRRPALESGGLAAALENTAAQVRNGSTAALDVAVRGTTRPLPALVEHHLLRIATEAATNAFKHACATRICIELRYEPDDVILRVTDDGLGFVASRVPGHTAGHFGLIGMRERSRKIGSVFVLDSAPGAGTRIEIRLRDQPPNRRAGASRDLNGAELS